MQEQNSHTSHAPVTQPWSAAELSTLASLAPRTVRRSELLRTFPGRTLNAIKVKLSAERKRQGVSVGNTATLKARETEPAMLSRDDEGMEDDWPLRWRRKAVVSNSRFLDALRHAA
jgi:hypothetical protein